MLCAPDVVIELLGAELEVEPVVIDYIDPKLRVEPVQIDYLRCTK